MKKMINFKTYMVAVFIVFLFHGINTAAQNDTIVVESEIIDNHDIYYKHKYQYLDVSLSDETRLFKFALQPFKPSENYNFGVLSLQLAYEKKLTPSISLTNEINANMMWTESGNVRSTGFAIGTRWYPGKNSRIDQGLSGNNCNGYYLGLKANNLLKSTAFRDSATNIQFLRGMSFRPIPEVSIGFQQRLTKLFYVDASTFVNYNFYDEGGFGFGLLVLLGISLNVED